MYVLYGAQEILYTGHLGGKAFLLADVLAVLLKLFDHFHSLFHMELTANVFHLFELIFYHVPQCFEKYENVRF